MQVLKQQRHKISVKVTMPTEENTATDVTATHVVPCRNKIPNRSSCLTFVPLTT